MVCTHAGRSMRGGLKDDRTRGIGRSTLNLEGSAKARLWDTEYCWYEGTSAVVSSGAAREAVVISYTGLSG